MLRELGVQHRDPKVGRLGYHWFWTHLCNLSAYAVFRIARGEHRREDETVDNRSPEEIEGDLMREFGG